METQNQNAEASLLDQETLDLINDVRDHGEKTRLLLSKIHATLPTAEWVERGECTEADQPMYWFRSADCQFRNAQMALVRAIEQPKSF